MLRDEGLLAQGSLYDIANISLVHHANQALRAHKLFARDTDYIVKDDKVIIIDEFTGRMMEGRRYSEGLHQALEAKEGVSVQQENQTLASITFQNYFRLYPKLAGMTGTAMTEAGEFQEIYKLEVVDIPTNVPCIRADNDDEVYRTRRREVRRDRRHDRGVPGTRAAGSRRHRVDREIGAPLGAAEEEEGAASRVERALPRAGGGDRSAGGRRRRGDDRHQHGWARHRHTARRQRRYADQAGAERSRWTRTARRAFAPKSPRIARRCWKRAGCSSSAPSGTRVGASTTSCAAVPDAKGDPGASKFYLSLEDDLMRIFGSGRIDGMLQRLGLKEGEAIIHPWVNKALEKAQQKVEARNFEIRKNLLKFDDVMNDQRKVVYEQRKELMHAEDVAQMVADMRHNVIEGLVRRHVPANAYAEQWNMPGLHAEVLAHLQSRSAARRMGGGRRHRRRGNPHPAA